MNRPSPLKQRAQSFFGPAVELSGIASPLSEGAADQTAAINLDSIDVAAVVNACAEEVNLSILYSSPFSPNFVVISSGFSLFLYRITLHDVYDLESYICRPIFRYRLEIRPISIGHGARPLEHTSNNKKTSAGKNFWMIGSERARALAARWDSRLTYFIFWSVADFVKLLK